jgi:DNA topoisomerase-1
VAVRLVAEREAEIRAFVPEESWSITADLDAKPTFSAKLTKLDGKATKVREGETAHALVKELTGQPFTVASVTKKERKKRPVPPFITSKLQQDAARQLGFTPKRTMSVAQQLYEGVELGSEGPVGLITYMRTDSTRVSNDAIAQARTLIGDRFGEDYVPDKPNTFRTKAKAAQEAHEAIRPTDAAHVPDEIKKALTNDQFKLYSLIWNKFVASQMKPARFMVTTATFEHGDAKFVAQGEVEVFDGHLRVFNTGRSDKDDQRLPTTLREGAGYVPKKLETTQHFTQPPPRYSEATLVKELEKKGIGRPSTYATIISTIQDRGYVTLEQRRFAATELGEIVTDQLVAHFADMINTDFTSSMEEDLDQVESGNKNWRNVVQGFHDVFITDLEKADVEMKNLKKEPELSDRKCEKCGSPMAVLYNKRGKFLGCSKYPDCKNTMPMDGPRPKSEVVETDKVCEKCGKPMVIRTGSRGRFIACTGFPKCRNTASVDEDGNIIQPKPTGIACDKCGSDMVIKGSKRGPFLACSAFPKCRNAKPLPEELREKPKETGESCEKCGAPMVQKTSRWGKEFIACSAYPECKNTRNVDEQPSGEEAEGDAVEARSGAQNGDSPEPA